MMNRLAGLAHAAGATLLLGLALGAGTASAADDTRLWDLYANQLKGAKYVSLSHVIAPDIPVWYGFGPSKFEPAVDPKTGH
ncbi:MAG TPA: hypothetical protein VE175_12430, partial [Woeseiaceae bacterium]|nr:hypothetical protein [Woeseiaceae bacterium]